MEEARNILRYHEKRTNGDLTEWQERWILEAMEEYAMQFKNGMIEWMKKCNLLQNELLLIERKNAFGENFNSPAKCEQAHVSGRSEQLVCPACNGKGYEIGYDGYETIKAVEMNCKRCGGTGQTNCR